MTDFSMVMIGLAQARRQSKKKKKQHPSVTQQQKRKLSATGNRTRVSCVTGKNTSHYTIAELDGGIIITI